MNMRHVHEDHAEAARRGARGRADMVRKFSLKTVGEILRSEIQRIETVLCGASDDLLDEL
jgi:hypothetical protein